MLGNAAVTTTRTATAVRLWRTQPKRTHTTTTTTTRERMARLVLPDVIPNYCYNNRSGWWWCGYYYRDASSFVLPRGVVVIDCNPHSNTTVPPLPAAASAAHPNNNSSTTTTTNTHTTATTTAAKTDTTGVHPVPLLPRQLPPIPHAWQEFPPLNDHHKKTNPPPPPPPLRTMAMMRTLHMALKRVMEPPTLHVFASAAGATLVIGTIEATLMCHQWPFWESFDAGRFVVHYTIQNLFPSVVWETHDAKLVCTAIGMDPTIILHNLSGETTESAILLLQTQWLATSRYFFAGFMMIAQLFRAATISMECLDEYQQRIVKGREPPFLVDYQHHGLVVRLCGRDSHVSEVSLQHMGHYLFPVFEDPERVRFLVRKYSQGKRRPVYWCVRPGLYWRSYSWEQFPTGPDCFIPGQGHHPNNKILILEADATNGNDPLSIGTTALDLTLEDASEGFRSIIQRYRQQGLEAGRDFRTLRVYLGNSMEVTQTGGGHSYTLRHRVRYGKEIDILIDSRAPVLSKILTWCQSVTADKDRKLFFQTSSREYFLNLKTLLKEYGYDIYDPLDLRMLHTLRETLKEDMEQQQQHHHHPDGSMISNNKDAKNTNTANASKSFLSVLLDDPKYLAEELDEHGTFLSNYFFPNKNGTPSTLETGTDGGSKDLLLLSSNHNKTATKEMLRKVVRLAKLPRLVHMETTAETVNAVEALIIAGEVDASSCCALLDRQEGVAVLEATLRYRSEFVPSSSQKNPWEQRQRPPIPEAPHIRTPSTRHNEMDGKQITGTSVTTPKHPSGLQFICSSSIHDDILRQVRWWARLGYPAAEIQHEIDTQYQEILQKSHTIQKQVTTQKGY